SIESSWTPRSLRFTPDSPGYWPISVDVPPHGSVIQCKRLPSSPLPSNNWWWHEAMNIRSLSANAGKRMKIGVSDTNFQMANGPEHVDVIDQAGRSVGAGMIAEPIPSHGEIVCRIIGQRGSPGVSPYGLAPGAEIKAVVAVTPNGKLDLLKATTAVIYLA